MLIIPAIDLHNGVCVRLKQGEFAALTQFDNAPIERAAYFAQLGAKRLHIVDLDGARTGSMQQLPLITLMQQTGMQVQAGGGIRTVEQAINCFNAGIAQIVIGSIAIQDPELTLKIIECIGIKNIILAVDVRLQNNIPIPATHGWQNATNTTLWDLVSYYQKMGITEVLCTDISCDGMMSGPNFALYQEAALRFPDINWQASGGIREAQDIKQLDRLGVYAAILGLTLYQNHFDLAQSLAEYANTGVMEC